MKTSPCAATCAASSSPTSASIRASNNSAAANAPRHPRQSPEARRNVIILDEPTNDLDLATLRLLEEALLIFQGSIIVVSHDRYFLNRICTHTLAFEGDAAVTLTAGNYDYYLEKRSARTASSAPQPAVTKSPTRATKIRKLTYKEQRELETIESDIEAAEQQATSLEERLAEVTSSGANAHEWPAFEAQMEQAKSRVTHLLHRWEELESIRANSV